MRASNGPAEDGPSILQLLSAAQLPIDGLLDHLDTAVVARAHKRVIGCAALEVYADGALLRSVLSMTASTARGSERA